MPPHTAFLYPDVYLSGDLVVSSGLPFPREGDIVTFRSEWYVSGQNRYRVTELLGVRSLAMTPATTPSFPMAHLMALSAVDRLIWPLANMILRTSHFPVLLTHLRAALVLKEPSAGKLLDQLEYCTDGPRRFKDLVALTLDRYPDQLEHVQLSDNELTVRGSPIWSPRFPEANPVAALQEPNNTFRRASLSDTLPAERTAIVERSPSLSSSLDDSGSRSGAADTAEAPEPNRLVARLAAGPHIAGLLAQWRSPQLPIDAEVATPSGATPPGASSVPLLPSSQPSLPPSPERASAVVNPPCVEHHGQGIASTPSSLDAVCRALRATVLAEGALPADVLEVARRLRSRAPGVRVVMEEHGLPGTIRGFEQLLDLTKELFSDMADLNVVLSDGTPPRLVRRSGTESAEAAPEAATPSPTTPSSASSSTSRPGTGSSEAVSLPSPQSLGVADAWLAEHTGNPPDDHVSDAPGMAIQPTTSAESTVLVNPEASPDWGVTVHHDPPPPRAPLSATPRTVRAGATGLGTPPQGRPPNAHPCGGQELLRLLPRAYRGAVMADVLEVTTVSLDVGCRPQAFCGERRLFLEEDATVHVSQEEIDEAVACLGNHSFVGSERIVPHASLLRVAALRNPAGSITGLTFRALRPVVGLAATLSDVLLEQRCNVLIIGEAGAGKTTALRDVARLLAASQQHVMAVDTVGDLGGDGDAPHPALGLARRLRVPAGADQAAALEACWRCHRPQVMVVDEIMRPAEVDAVQQLQGSVRLVAGVRGSLPQLVQHRHLARLLGVELPAAVHGVACPRRVEEPLFDCVVQLRRDAPGVWDVFPNVAEVVDRLLRGEPYVAHRRRDPRDSQACAETVTMPGERR
eukprot:EG_transcript_2469